MLRWILSLGKVLHFHNAVFHKKNWYENLETVDESSFVTAYQKWWELE